MLAEAKAPAGFFCAILALQRTTCGMADEPQIVFDVCMQDPTDASEEELIASGWWLAGLECYEYQALEMSIELRSDDLLPLPHWRSPWAGGDSTGMRDCLSRCLSST